MRKLAQMSERKVANCTEAFWENRWQNKVGILISADVRLRRRSWGLDTFKLQLIIFAKMDSTL